jgi:hypothetical protein
VDAGEAISRGVGWRAWKCMGVSLTDVGVVGAHGHDDVVPDAARHRQHVPPPALAGLDGGNCREGELPVDRQTAPQPTTQQQQ